MDAAKWSKVFEQDLSALKSVMDGPRRIQVGLEKTEARRDVDALLQGRQI
jgi:hypothetical protein